MARLVLTDLLTLGMSQKHTSTDWQVATDRNFTDLLIDIVKDPDNLYRLRTPIRNHDGTIYTSKLPLYARCRTYITDEYMPWYYLPSCNSVDMNALTIPERHEYLDYIEATMIERHKYLEYI